MARPRKDPALKALQGTLREDREPQPVDDAIAGPMISPLHLSDLAQLQFARIAAMLEAEKRASPHYADIVALLAQRLEQIERYQAVLSIEGDTCTSRSLRKMGDVVVETIMVRARPEVAMLNEAMRHAQSLLSELMLSPTAAQRIAQGHKPTAGAFDDF